MKHALICVLVVLPAFLSGCEFQADKDVKEAKEYYRKGNTYYELEQYPEAIAAYKKAININSDYAEAYLWMGYAYEKLKQYADAIAAHKKAVSIKPDDAYAYNGMGNAYHNSGQYADAITAYKKAISIEPKGELADYARKKISEIENREKSE
jgi:tetratricopeptide (TPR) repeat protein